MASTEHEPDIARMREHLHAAEDELDDLLRRFVRELATDRGPG